MDLSDMLLTGHLPALPRFTVELPPDGDARAFELEILDGTGTRLVRVVVEPGDPAGVSHAAERSAASRRP